MKWSILIFLNIGFFLFTSRLKALEGIKNFEQHIYEKNQEILSLQNNIKAKEALSSSSNSIYYPTLNAVGGLGDYRTDEFSTNEKGYIGYLEGRLNLFKGFKDQAVTGQREIDFEYSKLELESKKRDIKLQLTEIFSDMIFLHKLQNILEEEYNVTQTQRKMAAKKVSAGLTGSVDNLEFDLRESEIQIEQKQLNQKHQETHQKFIKMYGEDVLDKDLESIDFSQIELLFKTPDKIKIENTIDYQKTVLAQKRLELERKEISSDYLPSLDFTYAAGRLTPSEDSPIKFNEYKYALLVTVPLFSGFNTYYRSRSAVLSVQSTENLKIQKLNEVTSDFNISKNKMSELADLFRINEKKIKNSQKYFDLTLGEYKRGIKNSPDLVSATERLFLAKKKKYEILKEIESLKIKQDNFN